MHESKKKKGQTSYLIGRQSTLNIYQSRRQSLVDVDEETNVQRKGSCGLDEQVAEGSSGMPDQNLETNSSHVYLKTNSTKTVLLKALQDQSPYLVRTLAPCALD